MQNLDVTEMLERKSGWDGTHTPVVGHVKIHHTLEQPGIFIYFILFKELLLLL